MKKTKGAKGDPNASFFVQIRRLERQLMKDALVYSDWNEHHAADILGIEVSYLRSRGHRLGGVFKGEAINEPYSWESHQSKPKSKGKSRNAEPQDELPAAGEVADDPGESTDDAAGSSGGLDANQGRDGSDDDQPGNGEHLQPD